MKDMNYDGDCCCVKHRNVAVPSDTEISKSIYLCRSTLKKLYLSITLLKKYNGGTFQCYLMCMIV